MHTLLILLSPTVLTEKKTQKALNYPEKKCPSLFLATKLKTVSLKSIVTLNLKVL